MRNNNHLMYIYIKYFTKYTGHSTRRMLIARLQELTTMQPKRLIQWPPLNEECDTEFTFTTLKNV